MEYPNFEEKNLYFEKEYPNVEEVHPNSKNKTFNNE